MTSCLVSVLVVCWAAAFPGLLLHRMLRHLESPHARFYSRGYSAIAHQWNHLFFVVSRELLHGQTTARYLFLWIEESNYACSCGSCRRGRCPSPMAPFLIGSATRYNHSCCSAKDSRDWRSKSHARTLNRPDRTSR